MYVSLFSLFWALNILVSRWAIAQGVHPLTLTFQMSLLTIFFLLLYLVAIKSRKIFSGSTSSKVGVIISSLIAGGLANVIGYQGLALSTATNYGFLVKLATVFTIIFAFFFLGEPLSKKKWFFVLVSILGAYFLSTRGNLLTPHMGDILIILSAVGYSSATIIVRKVLKRDMDPDIVSLYRAVFGIVPAFLAVLLFAKPLFSLQFAFPLVLAALTNSLLYIYLNKTLQVASASYMTLMSMSVPVIVAVVAVPLFGDQLNTWQWIGAFLIVVGGIATQTTRVAHHD